jgi:hypothetical protein
MEDPLTGQRAMLPPTSDARIPAPGEAATSAVSHAAEAVKPTAGN